MTDLLELLGAVGVLYVTLNWWGQVFVRSTWNRLD